jgi:hypothetical protein
LDGFKDEVRTYWFIDNMIGNSKRTWWIDSTLRCSILSLSGYFTHFMTTSTESGQSRSQRK